MSGQLKLRILVFVAAAAGAAMAVASDPSEPAGPLELAVAKSFKDGGGYLWKDSTGSPIEIRHDGQVVLAKQPQGTYCSGFTFAVAMETARRRDLLQGKSFDEVKRFQKQWYGAVPEAAEKQCALAVERLGIGTQVKSLAEARPGDFLQLWRTNKSGHSVVLLKLIRERDQIVGIRYRSTQKSTDGIGDRTEYFADVPGDRGKLDRQRIYIARLHQPTRPAPPADAQKAAK
ncbi:MAG: hypothetical protein CMJ58_19015 [Planctomycetaceae bacterium]|nr:hypothetical protein [Planctomycetaceae bacterium]